MNWVRDIPDALSQAQLSVESIDGFVLLEPLKWNDVAKQWALRFRACPDSENTADPLNNSEWYLVLDHCYPFGRIDVFPAKLNGIVETYPHQQYNHGGDPALPWRAGNICTSTQARRVGRQGYDVEPYASEDRLRWHCERAIEWVRCAKEGTLLRSGEPFELPLVPPICKVRGQVMFSEQGLDAWSRIGDTLGRARCFKSKRDENSWFVDLVLGSKNEELAQTIWGHHVTRYRGEPLHGIWLRLQTMPLVKPYRFPETWGELRQTLSDQGIHFKDALRKFRKLLRSGDCHFLLLGFAIPAICGGLGAATHWLTIRLPVLSRGKEYPEGLRGNELGYVENDMQTRFGRNKRLVYIETENWHEDQIQTRGRYPERVRLSRVALIGCGALGSAIAELLVRGGVRQITLFDDDLVTIGNLTRHTLTLDDLRKHKADEIARRLNSANPHADIAFVCSKLSSGNEEILTKMWEHDVVLDCTGDDQLLHVLSSVSSPKPLQFVSVSIGFRAKRMFFFHAKGTEFPTSQYFSSMTPWKAFEQTEFAGEEFPREGIGCYHPVFPARCDDIWLWSSVAAKLVSARIVSACDDPKLHVYELHESGEGVSVRSVEQEPDDG